MLVHPESPEGVVAQADVVGSTSGILKAAETLPNTQFIVATDRGIFSTLQRKVPGKQFIEAPTAGNGATCRSCAHCPWMAMNELEAMLASLETGLTKFTFPRPWQRGRSFPSSVCSTSSASLRGAAASL